MIQDISVFSTSTYLAQIAYFLRGFLNASIVGPTMYGLWAALNIILSFGFYVHLGVLHGMSREIPYSLGKGDAEKAEAVRANAFGFTLIASVIVAICIATVSLFFKKSMGTVEMLGILTVSLLIIAQNAVNFYEMALSAVKRFSIIAITYGLFPMMCVILTMILVPKWNIYGIYTVAILGPLAMSLFFAFKTRYRPKIRFQTKEVFRLIKIGLPLMSLLLFPFILFVIDRMLIFKFLGITALGYYALSLLICKFLLYLPEVVGRVVEPRLFHKYGEREKVSDLRKYLFVPAEAMSVFLPLLIGIVYFVSSFVIRHFIPQYIPSLAPLFILLFGKFFLLFSPTTVSFLTALNKQHRMLHFYLIAIALSALLDIAVLVLGFGLVGVASATAAVSFFLGTCLFIYASRVFLKGWLSYLGTCARMYLPYLNILAFTLVLNFTIKSDVFLKDLASVFLKAFILTAASLPFVLCLNKKIGLFEEVISFIRGEQ